MSTAMRDNLIPVDKSSRLPRHHGEDAALEAAQRPDAWLDKGEMDAYLVWKRVLAAVKEIQREEPGEGEAVS